MFNQGSLYSLLLLALTCQMPAASRTVSFTPVLTLSGEDIEAALPDFWNDPGVLQADDEGNIYIARWECLSRISSDGKSVTPLCRQGQGPGEVTLVRGFVIQDRKIVVYNLFPSKIIVKSLDGTLLHEYRNPDAKGMDRLCGCWDETYIGYCNTEYPPLADGHEQTVDFPVSFMRGKGRKTALEMESLPQVRMSQSMYVVAEGARASSPLVAIHVQQIGPYLFWSSTARYAIQRINLLRNVVDKTITPDYDRQLTPPELPNQPRRPAFLFGAKKYYNPVPEYQNDVRLLLVHNGSLWVMTSRVSPGAGVSVDVYSPELVLQRRFEMKLSERVKPEDYSRLVAAVRGSYLYALEKDGEENPLIVKYRIDGI